MHVAVEKYVSRFKRSFHHQFSVIINRVELARATHPLSVKVRTHERTSVVADNNSIWVLHRDYFENKSVAKELSVGVFPDQKVYDTVHDP